MHRPEVRHVAQYHVAAGRRAAASTSIGTPGATPLDLDERAARGRGRRARPAVTDGRRRLELDRRHRRFGCSLAAAPAPMTDLDRPRAGSSRPTTAIRTIGPCCRCRCRSRSRRAGPSTVEIAWTAHVPRTFARTGAIGNFYFIAQWFPKIGVLEDAGWNTHQFHAGTEFFSDYGVYDVRITVPRGWVVGATGRERSAARHAGRQDRRTVRAGGRPRFRVDDEPGLRRAHRDGSSTAAAAVSRCGCCCSRNTRARQSAISTRRARRCSRTAVVRPVSVRPHHDRRSGLAERRRRHGVSDALHGRHTLAGAAGVERHPKA